LTPFALVFAHSGNTDLENVVSFLEERDENAAARFEEQLKTLVTGLCQRIPQEIEQIGKPFHSLDEPAPLHYARPVYRERIETVKRRARRSSTGLWYVYYTLEDRGKTGTPNTIVILRIRHSAARPFTLDVSEEDE
jgi:plasmid stabilization system protein ParE